MAETSDDLITLDDPRWWSLSETLAYCRRDPLFRLEDLAAAVDQEQVHCKLAYLDRSTRPAKRMAMLLTSEFFKREAAITSRLALMARTEKAAQMRPYALSFWSPDIKKFCGRSASETSTEPAATPASVPEAGTIAEPAAEPIDAPFANTSPAAKSKPRRPRSLSWQRTEAILRHLYPGQIPSEDEVTKADLFHAVDRNWNSAPVPNPAKLSCPSPDTVGRVVDDLRSTS
jgi:hypothetical protein